MKKIFSIIVILAFAVSCINYGTKETTSEEIQITFEDSPKIEHGVNCGCDSLFGYKLCDTLNFGGVKIKGRYSIEKAEGTFYFQTTPITKAPYAIVIEAHDYIKMQNALFKNIKNFKFIFSKNELSKRYREIIDSENIFAENFGIGKKDGKEYFSYYVPESVPLWGTGLKMPYKTCLIITDLSLLKLYEKEQYELDAPKREAIAREKAEREQNAQIFPI